MNPVVYLFNGMCLERMKFYHETDRLARGVGGVGCGERVRAPASSPESRIAPVGVFLLDKK
jgi:hypothetical protein